MFRQNDGMYRVCNSFGLYQEFIFDVTLTPVIFSELHHL